MYSALAGTLMILSLGILMAHAMDALRSSQVLVSDQRADCPPPVDGGARGG
jgi:hypothetical protein